jgi:galactose mutarotase-like enzyme
VGASMGDEVVLQSDGLRVACAPAQGLTVTSITDRTSGAEALWRRRSHRPAPCSRSLGPSGDASIETFIDVFVGGWFEMFPAVGFPAPDDSTSLLHGELVRLPWELLEWSETVAVARVHTVRSPFEVTRRLEVLGGMLHITEQVANDGSEAAPYAWGHHPCFERATFAGGRLELDVRAASVPSPPYDPAASVFAPGRFSWPSTRRVDGGAIDVSAIPGEPDGRQDHACLTPATGRARLTAPAAGRAFLMTWDLEPFPYLLVWENFRTSGGWPFWGGADTLAVEFSSNPGRTMADAAAADAVRILEPGETVDAVVSAWWEAL